MRFNPRLIGWDDAQPQRPHSPDLGETSAHAEENLTDDLLLLTEQLSDDAQRLSVMYPAGNPDIWMRRSSSDCAPKKRKFSGAWYWSAAAVLLIGLGVGLGMAWTDGSRTGVLDDLFAPRQLAGPLQHRAPAPAIPHSEAAPLVPVGIFQALSGPEQEALLDLMESKGYGQQSLSI